MAITGIHPDHASEIAVVGIDDRRIETAATDRHRHRRLLGQLSGQQRNRDPDVAQDSAVDETKERSTAGDEQPLQCIAEVTQEELAPEVEESAEARKDMKNFQDLKVKVEATRPEF